MTIIPVNPFYYCSGGSIFHINESRESMKAGNGAQRSDRIDPRKEPVAARCYAPGFHSIDFSRQGSSNLR